MRTSWSPRLYANSGSGTSNPKLRGEIRDREELIAPGSVWEKQESAAQLIPLCHEFPPAAAAQIHGTGLGLSLAKNIAEAMQGHLTVVSEPGRGTTFTLHLPCLVSPSSLPELGGGLLNPQTRD